MNPPRVSIVIPVYNGSDYLREAIDSALSQTYNNIEVIVVNDGSVDGGRTERVALSFRDKLRYFSKTNGGVASALNMGIREMSGDYFSWLSHDDIYLTNKVETQINALSQWDDKTILYSDFSIFGENPMVCREIHLPNTPPEYFRVFITVSNILHGCTLLIPRRAFDDCGMFDEKLRTTQDYDLWFRLAEKYRFIHLPQVMVRARSHENQGSAKLADIALKECDQLLSGFIRHLSLDELSGSGKKSVGLAYAEIALNCKQRGFRGAWMQAVILSLKNFGRGSVTDGFRQVRAIGNSFRNYGQVVD